ncbi:C-terminal binding protein AN [Physcomitrium patens]|uniref:Angustifolia2-1 n=1 Tax=Physcomitrium patens TaxID=3218 RepID=B9WZ86_PHYPA|nr:C-terminal binding protein AN-like [Physcomitrium patens]PNR58160.1 hypothetical protein PHYPA_005155 [Physcomitrium patens]BAH23867.1 angustifolia2-1 [Physcomitrium patens]BAH23868.1 angustifolia2-1 [Physcomitrium patens]|eukprot:XP_024370957.1 C-terminal binding protein AN-like [Physcomitrella patens]
MGKVQRAAAEKKWGGAKTVTTQVVKAEANARDAPEASRLPLVIALNCLPDCSLEEKELKGVAKIEHVSLAQLGEGKIEAASAVLLHSLAHLPRAAQRRLQPWHLILTLSCMDKMVDSALANELGLQLLHVDSAREEEIADTVLALLLGLLRHTHVLASHGYASAGWLGTIHSLCKGMRRSKGMVIGIVGATAPARAVASRSLAFRMKVQYFDPEEGKENQRRRAFPAGAEKINCLKQLLSTSDIVTLHCELTNDTVQLINTDSLQHMKPGAVVVNTSSSHLLDDCAMKEALINGTIAGCALDGIEGPQWLEAWVREMPNVLILPRSADYSEEVWAEIRCKAVSVLCSYFVDGVIPSNALIDDDDNDDDAYSNQAQSLPWQEEATKPSKVEKNEQSKRSVIGSSQDTASQKGAFQEFRSKQQQLYYQA